MLIIFEKIMKRNIFVLLIAILGVSLSLPVSAAALKSGETVTIGKKQHVNEDLYVGAGNVTIAGTVEKDATIGAGTVVLNGSIVGDATIAAGTVEILGPVGEDLRVGAGSLKIGDEVKGDVVVGGGSIEITEDAVIEGDLIVGAGSVLIGGTVKGDVRVGGGEVTINGTLEKDARIYASNGLTIGADAVIKGDVNYSAVREASVLPGAQLNGKLTFSVLESSDRGFANGYWLIVKLSTLLIAALFGILFFPKLLHRMTENGVTKFGPEFLRGLLVLIVTPIVLVILLATIIGSILGVIGGLAYVILLLLAKVFSGVLFGAWLYKLITKQKELVVDWKIAIFGILLLEIVLVIPVVGMVIGALLFVVTLGALVHLLQTEIQAMRK